MLLALGHTVAQSLLARGRGNSVTRGPNPAHARKSTQAGVFTTLGSALFVLVNLAIVAYALAQQPVKLPKVAILSIGAPTTETCAAFAGGSSLPCFMDAMRELGYVEGKNVLFEFRFAEGDYKTLPALATELVGLRPDVIYTTGPGASAAANATTTIPIVAGPASEETLTRLAGNLPHPIKNVTGFALSSIEQDLKCLQLLKVSAPRTSRVAVLFDPDNPSYRNYSDILASGAAQLGMTLIKIESRMVSDLPQAFVAITASAANAIYIGDEAALAGTIEWRKQVIEWALSRRLPLASANSDVASEGGLVSLGTYRPVLTRRAAFYVDKILKGAKPADLPVERPSVFKLSVNLKTARSLGLTMPRSLLVRADEVIQ
jgi:putative tryptophan/tyrosine transport system substrate-binding protein